MVKKVKLGIIGCGKISGIYLKRCKEFDILSVVACSDLVRERAEAAAKEYSIPRSCTVDDMLADPEIEIIVNLTVPQSHAEVSISALEAGKNVYVEKPLAVEREQGQHMLQLAKEKRLLVGAAPDTFLGGGLQTCRKLIDDGWIGEPIGATAFLLIPGHESWHPDPEFYYKKGGGPMFDMGPYYLTALLSLLGPVKRVTGSDRITAVERTITSQPKYGQKIKVEVPTHVAGIFEFASGVIGTIITSFDVKGTQLPRVEIYGSRATLSVPDPNTFGGPVQIFCPDEKQWQKIPLTHGYAENYRGLGVADMASAIREGRKNRASGKMAYHVLDIMHAFHDASRTGRHIELQSSCERPEPLQIGSII